MESLRINELGETRKWEDLPSDCLANIFKRVGMKSLILLNVPFVCTSWYSASLNPNCWKNLDFSSFTTSVVSEVPGMVNFAVNRSHFLATKFVIGNLFDNYKIDDVLHCISEGCPALKILKISPYTKLPSYTPQYIQKWKDLEFLCIGGSQYHPPIFKELLEQISIHCKNFVGISTAFLSYSSEGVSMIVAFIPNIKYLFLKSSYLERDDLILLLSKCRDLVSLDVRYCIGFDSDDAEITQMASHITNFMCQGSDLFDGEPEENYIDHDPIVYEGNSSSSIGFHFDDAALTQLNSIMTTFVSGFSFSDDDDHDPMVYDGNLSS